MLYFNALRFQMKSIFFLFIFCLANVCSAQFSQKLDLKDFSKLNIGNNFQVSVKKGNAFQLTLSGEQSDVNDVRGEVKNGELSLYFKEKKFRTRRIQVELTMPQLYAINFSGTVLGTVERGFSYDNFVIYLSGATKLDIYVETTKLFVNVAGSSELFIQGRADNLKASI
ncbi:MAG: DUF2807 domain-containing protein, partial [Verrucomicrobia bacterium]|nr:DUF2807 domain-containing protein [Cytophagales bacterium]